MANALTLFQKTNNVGVFGKKFIIGDRASLVSSKDNALPASLSKSRVDALTKDFDFISRHLRQKTKHDRSRRVSFAICERRGDPPPARTPPARIGIKATTNESMGFLGRSEGMAALATACVDRLEE
jgi:hypothetical protein